METYETQEEEVLALQYWWEENRVTIISAVTALLVGAGSWSGGQYLYAEASEAAANVWQETVALLQSADDEIIDSGEREQLRELSEKLLEMPVAGIYGDYARLLLARLATDAGDEQAATENLEQLLEDKFWLFDSVERKAISTVARFALARLALSAEEYQRAQELLVGVPKEATVLMDDLKGDIALAQGDYDVAAAAYQRVLEGNNSQLSQVAALKLSSLKYQQGFMQAEEEVEEDNSENSKINDKPKAVIPISIESKK